MITQRPGHNYMSDTATANYADNRMEIQGNVSNLKIIAVADISYAINREEDTDAIDGEVKAGEELNFSDFDYGLSSIAIKGSGAFRVWAYS